MRISTSENGCGKGAHATGKAHTWTPWTHVFIRDGAKTLMGYYIGNIVAVSPTDKHAYFLYFVPPRSWGHEFEFEWIDKYIMRRFPEIASAVGPEGVIIAPSPKNTDRYLENLLNVSGGGCFFSGAYSELTGKQKSWEGFDYILESGHPFLVFSQSPLQLVDKKNHAIIIKLSAYKDEKALGRVVDVLVSVVKRDDWKLLRDLPSAEAKTPGWEAKVLKSFQLKPNIFGVGVDFNHLLLRLSILIRSRLSGGMERS